MSEQTNGNVPEIEESSSETTTEVPNVSSIREEYNLPDNWTDDQVILWASKLNDALPITVNGTVFVYDPTRLSRPVHEWPTEELLAYVEGKLIGTDHYDWNKKAYAIVDEVVIKELKRRINIEPAWMDQQILDYYRDGIEPAKSSNGVWVIDVTRVKRKAPQWSDAELIAWLNREISAIGSATYTHLMAEINKRKITGDSKHATE